MNRTEKRPAPAGIPRPFHSRRRDGPAVARAPPQRGWEWKHGYGGWDGGTLPDATICRNRRWSVDEKRPTPSARPTNDAGRASYTATWSTSPSKAVGGVCGSCPEVNGRRDVCGLVRWRKGRSWRGRGLRRDVARGRKAAPQRTRWLSWNFAAGHHGKITPKRLRNWVRSVRLMTPSPLKSSPRRRCDGWPDPLTWDDRIVSR